MYSANSHNGEGFEAETLKDLAQQMNGYRAKWVCLGLCEFSPKELEGFNLLIGLEEDAKTRDDAQRDEWDSEPLQPRLGGERSGGVV